MNRVNNELIAIALITQLIHYIEKFSKMLSLDEALFN